VKRPDCWLPRATRWVLHARDEARAREALAGVPGAAAALAGDLASIAQTTELAHRANESGPFDAVIHNAGIGYREPRRIATEDGLAHVFHVNVLAPYLLSALIRRPARLVYLSSGLHRAGNPRLDDLQWVKRPWHGYQAYADSKLFDAVLAAAVARRWPEVVSSSVDPGWVKTRMGGPTAPGSIGPGYRDTGLARHDGGSARAAKRRPLLPSTIAADPPHGLRPGGPGGRARRLPRPHGPRTPSGSGRRARSPGVSASRVDLAGAD